MQVDIDTPDIRPWSPAFVGADPAPTSPIQATNSEWRNLAVATRKAKKLSQDELGRRVGTSQNIISLIESGGVDSSQFVLPICRVLHIPAPMFFVNDAQRRWSIVGHRLEEVDPDQFAKALALFESMVPGAGSRDGTPPEPPTPAPAVKPKAKARSVGRANVGLPESASRALRAADETPAEVAARKKR